MTSRMQNLIEKAKQAGYKVEPDGSSTVIYKTVGRWSKKEGIYVYADGSMFDVAADLSAAKKLTYAAAYSHLGI